MTKPDTDYRRGTPSLEEVRAHQRQGGYWHSRYKGHLQIRRLRVFPAGHFALVEMIGQEVIESRIRNRMTWLPVDARTFDANREWRPCSPRGDARGWPRPKKEDDPQVVGAGA